MSTSDVQIVSIRFDGLSSSMFLFATLGDADTFCSMLSCAEVLFCSTAPILIHCGRALILIDYASKEMDGIVEALLDSQNKGVV